MRADLADGLATAFKLHMAEMSFLLEVYARAADEDILPRPGEVIDAAAEALQMSAAIAAIVKGGFLEGRQVKFAIFGLIISCLKREVGGSSSSSKRYFNAAHDRLASVETILKVMAAHTWSTESCEPAAAMAVATSAAPSRQATAAEAGWLIAAFTALAALWERTMPMQRAGPSVAPPAAAAEMPAWDTAAARLLLLNHQWSSCGACWWLACCCQWESSSKCFTTRSRWTTTMTAAVNKQL